MRKIEHPDNEDQITTIKVSKSTRNELAKMGTMDDNYDTVIQRLIKSWRVSKGSNG